MKTTIEAMKQAISALITSNPSQAELAAYALRKAIQQEEAQTVEPSGFALAAIGCKHFGNPIPKEWYAAARELLAVHPAPATEPAKPLSGKRKELVDGLRESATIVESDGWAFGDELREAADMPAADACSASRERHTRETLRKVLAGIEAQQVAVPQGWNLVPVEPTSEMVQACNARFIPSIVLPVFVAAYKTMLSAAPQPPQADECYRDKQGIGKPGVTCGDCPRDYLPPHATMQKSGDAHEIWAAAQLAPGKGIEDGVLRVEALLDAARVPMTKSEVKDQMTDLAYSAYEEAMAFGLSLDTFTRYMQAVVSVSEAHHGIGVNP